MNSRHAFCVHHERYLPWIQDVVLTDTRHCAFIIDCEEAGCCTTIRISESDPGIWHEWRRYEVKIARNLGHLKTPDDPRWLAQISKAPPGAMNAEQAERYLSELRGKLAQEARKG